MITGYDIQKINNEKVLILYLNYDSEFGMDFHLHHKNSTMKKEIKKFIAENKIHFDGEKIALSFGGIILAILLLTENPSMIDNLNFTYVSNNILPNPIPETLTMKTWQENEDEAAKMEPNVNQSVEQEATTTNQVTSTKIESSSETNTNINTNKNTTSSTPTNSNMNSTESSNSTITSSDNSTNIDTSIQENANSNEQQVTIYRKNGSVITLSLEEYLIGVVGAEMPASFSIEALKAQAVVARTYALKKIENGDKLTDSVSTQSYKDDNELKQLWGSSYNTYYQKVKNAVEATKGLAIYYQGELIDAVYHSTSNGKTEDAVYVWGNDIPYLKSVDSSWDKEASSYLRETTKDFMNVLNLLGIDIRENINFEILSRDDSGRVLEIKVGNKTFSGVEFRTLLGLRSTDFDLELNDETLNITTRGYGHGVGMSQYGANGMAKQGYTYKQILKHYYTGISIY